MKSALSEAWDRVTVSAGGPPEEQQVATGVQGIRPLGGNCLTGQSQPGKALRPQSPECLLPLQCLLHARPCHLSLVSVRV